MWVLTVAILYIYVIHTGSYVFLGQALYAGGKQLYYGNYQYHYRHQWFKRSLQEAVVDMDRVDGEDRISIHRKIASETGFTGKSELHRLHVLYQFNTLNDLVFDIMHTLLLGVVKRHIDFYKNQGYLSNPVIEERLKKMPWTAGDAGFYTIHPFTIIAMTKSS